MKKNILAALLILAMMLSLAACGTSSATPAATEAPAATEEPSATEEPIDDGMEVQEEAVVNEADTVKGEGVMTYADYAAAALDSEVTVECYVQAHQSWWDNKITVYAMDADGGYFLYNMTCSEEDSALLVPGTKIKVTGYKTEWSGEVEIADATFEVEEGSYIAPSVDVTDFLGTDELINYQNQYGFISGATVVASKIEGDETEYPFLYSWDGSGTHDGNSDLYFNVEVNGQTYTMTVESYLCDNTTAIYEAVENLKIGDMIDIEAFLYWYNGLNPHVTSIMVL